jgi:acetylornithine deacetylase/succinyl-diaminopimelate desuccinylase-like protein
MLKIGIATPLILAFAVSAAAQTDIERAREWRRANEHRIVAEFSELLSIPNVASDGPNIRRNAEFIAERFRRRGARMELLEVEGAPPAVFGELLAPGAARTIGIYVHYDGQPVDPAQWSTPPWTPTLYSGPIDAGGRPVATPAPGEAFDPERRLYARSASDDKGPIGALWAALDALRAAEIPLTSNIKFFFEGEEEAGSPKLRDTFERYKDRLEVDAWLICDGPVHQSRRPQLTFGVRGVTGMDVTIYGATRNLHSGHYGNWSPNPAVMLANLIASMRTDDGRVLIEGFYDSTEPLGEAERRAIAAMPDYDDELRRELGLVKSEANNASLMERLMLPALNVRGIAAAGVGATANNVIPNRAELALGVRLVKGNDPERMLDLVEAHIRKQGYHVVREAPDAATRLAHEKIARVVRDKGYPAARTSMEGPFVESLIAAVGRASDEPVVLKPSSGGSLPLYLFNEILGRPVVQVPMVNHDNNQHAPDENLRIANLWYGIDLMAAILTMPDN